MQNRSPDFEEFFALLNKNEVRYLVVGGYAFAVHAFPRFTNDLDIWIAADKQNAEKILTTLREFGFRELEVTREDFMTPNKIIQIGYPPMRIDILTSVDGVGFKDAWKNKISGEYGKQTIHLISKDHLIQNKKVSGRKKDHRDLEDLENSWRQHDSSGRSLLWESSTKQTPRPMGKQRIGVVVSGLDPEGIPLGLFILGTVPDGSPTNRDRRDRSTQAYQDKKALKEKVEIL